MNNNDDNNMNKNNLCADKNVKFREFLFSLSLSLSLKKKNLYLNEQKFKEEHQKNTKLFILRFSTRRNYFIPVLN